MSSTALIANIRKPLSQCGYQPAQCPSFLVDFLIELRDFYPEFYAFLVHNTIVHLGTGKHIIADIADIAAIEATPTVSVMATPKRRAGISRTPSSPSATLYLNKDQKASYEYAPAVVQRFDGGFAALVSQCMQTTAARNALYKACGPSGRAMILHLEERGKGAIGTPLHMLALHRLNLRQMAGVEPPVTSDSWAAYASELEHFAASAGGVPDEIMVNHLRMALYAFTDADLRSDTIKAAATVTTAIDVTTAVATAIDTHTLTVLLTTRMRDPTAANPRATLAVTDAQTDTLTALYAQRRPDPPKAGASFDRHPPAHNHADARTKYVWAAAQDPPCLNWIRSREGCDGRHHLPQCPLPRLPAASGVGAVALELDAEDSFPHPFPRRDPALVLTAPAVTAPAPAAAVSFSQLFGNGTVDMHFIDNAAAAAVLTVTSVTAEPETIAMDVIDIASTLGDDQCRYADMSGLPDDFPESGVE